MSKVHENFNRAILKDAVLREKFWFKTNIVTAICKDSVFSSLKTGNCKDIIEELTMQEIICGKGEYLGLVNYIEKYLLEVVHCCIERFNEISRYLNFIKKRASGEIPTGAHFLRNLILNHPDYRKDSIITSTIASEIVKIAKDETWNQDLLGQPF